MHIPRIGHLITQEWMERIGWMKVWKNAITVTPRKINAFLHFSEAMMLIAVIVLGLVSFTVAFRANVFPPRVGLRGCDRIGQRAPSLLLAKRRGPNGEDYSLLDDPKYSAILYDPEDPRGDPEGVDEGTWERKDSVGIDPATGKPAKIWIHTDVTVDKPQDLPNRLKQPLPVQPWEDPEVVAAMAEQGITVKDLLFMRRQVAAAVPAPKKEAAADAEGEEEQEYPLRYYKLTKDKGGAADSSSRDRDGDRDEDSSKPRRTTMKRKSNAHTSTWGLAPPAKEATAKRRMVRRPSKPPPAGAAGPAANRTPQRPMNSKGNSKQFSWEEK